jgi:hypothetical protein
MSLLRAPILVVLIAGVVALGTARLVLRRPVNRICDVSEAAIMMRDSVRAWLRDPESDFRRYYMDVTDSVGNLVPIKTPKTAVLVVNEKVCVRAAQAYHGTAGPPMDWPNNVQPVAVVRAGKFYIVEDARTLLHHGPDDYWETVLFDEQWKNIHNWGGGA